MMNIIRSINYETRKSKILIRMYIVFVLLMALIALLNINTDADNMTYTSGMLSENKTIPFMFPLFIVAMCIGYICCSDYKDKVINFKSWRLDGTHITLKPTNMSSVEFMLRYYWLHAVTYPKIIVRAMLGTAYDTKKKGWF